MKEPFDDASPPRSTSRPQARTHGFAFTRCIHLSKAEIVRAAQSSDECRALLEHVATIAKPRDGGPLVLLLFARLATVAWLDGDPYIVIEAAPPPALTRVTVATELGAGLREKVFPSFDLRVPLDEFTRAVTRIPQMVHPLVADVTRERLLLRPSERARTSVVSASLRAAPRSA